MIYFPRNQYRAHSQNKSKFKINSWNQTEAERPELPLEVRLGGLPEFGGLDCTEWIEAGPCEEAGDPLLALPTKGIPENENDKVISYDFFENANIFHLT